MKQGSVYYWYHNDHLGTPQVMTTSSGAVVWSATYTSFGKVTVDAGSTVVNPLRFPGQYEDTETRLHYNRFRYYDPNLGKYLRIDPIGFWSGDTNLYSYVFNNPAILFDPFGLEWKRKPWEVIPGWETVPMAIAYAERMRSMFKAEYERLSKDCKDRFPPKCNPTSYEKCMKDIQLWNDWSKSYGWPRAAVDSYAYREKENFKRYKERYRKELEGMRKLEEEKRKRMLENLKKWE